MEWDQRECAASVGRMIDMLHSTVEFVEQDLSYDLRRRVPNALLDIALSRLLRQEGRDGALTVLTALAAAVASGADPAADGPAGLADTRRRARTGSAPAAMRTANVVQMR